MSDDWRDDPRFSGKRKKTSKKTEARNQWDELGWLEQNNYGTFEEYYKTIKGNKTSNKSIKSKTKEVVRKPKESSKKTEARKQWDELGWLEQNNYGTFEEYYKTIKYDKSIKSKTKDVVKKEESTQDSDWRKALGINYEDKEDTRSAIRPKKKTQKKEESTQDSDWRKALGINYEDKEDTRSAIQPAIKTQKKEDGGGYGFIIIIGLIVIGAGIYFNYSGSSSSNKSSSSSNKSSTSTKDCFAALDGSFSKKGNAFVINFKNKLGDGVTITGVGIYIKNGKKIIKRTNINEYIKPYGVGSTKINFYDLNKDIVGTPFYSCQIGKSEQAKKREGAFDNAFKKKKSGFKWWYLLVAYIAFHVIRAIMAETSSKDKPSNVKQEEITEVKSSTTSSDDNIIEDVFEGRKPLAETFWLYYVLANGLISFGAGYLADSNDNNIYLIAALVSNIWAGIGTWNSSTNYQLEKIKSGQPYGWAYGAKIMIVLNFITIVGQAILLFSL